MGYVGPSVVERLRSSLPEAILIGLDMGFFSHCLTNVNKVAECLVDLQYFADTRNIPPEILNGVDAVIHLAAVSNDPMGKAYEKVTFDINHRASVELARKAKEMGARSFVFASSCSVYGFAEDGARTEQSSVNPLTAYAKSKVWTERDLVELADDHFSVTCLRFATACGTSQRLRLDLVLNDFVASAMATKRISVLSNGMPWRPLINTKDMARAFEWAVKRKVGPPYLVVNAGCDEWNYQIKDLAEAVAGVIPRVDVSINRNAPPDKRSYKVDFSLFKSLAPDNQPVFDLNTTVAELKSTLEAIRFEDADFRNSRYVRLRVLANLREHGLLTENLEWTTKNYWQRLAQREHYQAVEAI